MCGNNRKCEATCKKEQDNNDEAYVNEYNQQVMNADMVNTSLDADKLVSCVTDLTYDKQNVFSSTGGKIDGVEVLLEMNELKTVKLIEDYQLNVADCKDQKKITKRENGLVESTVASSIVCIDMGNIKC
eukprot:TRINITY_DN2623_c0_g1_i1.p2 TRINITY_DN2623_c0_g1~~TRINITY_DN2623_c0_g1_i1.p2  ORF type:complete len:129 (-),score=27.30 TRINITY_DN2623_c0_g1_i1:312-698(-)